MRVNDGKTFILITKERDKMKKIVYICVATPRNFDNGEGKILDNFKNEGYQIEVWVMRKVFKIGIEFESPEITKWKEYSVKNYKNFIHDIKKIKPNETIFLIDGDKSFDLCRIIICAMRGKYCNLMYYEGLCFFSENNHERIVTKKYSFMDFFPPIYTFVSAEGKMDYCLHSGHGLYKKRNVIIGHDKNYDLYLESKKSADESLIKGEYICFLGINPFTPHIDRNTMKEKSEGVINNLNLLFDRLEREFKIPVIIGAHPSLTDRSKEVYKNRKVFWGKTCELVKHCKMVVTLGSGSVEFAVLWEKPIIALETELFFDCLNGLSKIEWRDECKALGVKKICRLERIDKVSNFARYTTYPGIQYKKFIDRRIAPKYKNKLFSSVIFEYIDRWNKKQCQEK